MTGDVETEDGVLVVRRIHVRVRLVAAADFADAVERVHGFYTMRCPLYRTLRASIALSSSYELVPPPV